jgi:glycosyltransferase involved in cell wall biosynthesis
VILEAFARKCPVIASDIDAFDETVIEGKTGFRFKNASSESLAASLRRAMDEAGLLQEMGKNGYALLVERFTLDKMIDSTLQVYRSAINDRTAKT